MKSSESHLKIKMAVIISVIASFCILVHPSIIVAICLASHGDLSSIMLELVYVAFITITPLAFLGCYYLIKCVKDHREKIKETNKKNIEVEQ